MDANTSNNVSDALNVAAGGLMQYAEMQRQDRMERARMSFQQMLMDRNDAQHKADKDQEHSQFEESLSHQDKVLGAQTARDNAKTAREERFHSDTMSMEEKRLAAENGRAGASKVDQTNEKILAVYQNRAQHATALHLQAVNEMEGKLKQNPMEDPAIDAANQRVQQAYAPIIQKYSQQADAAYQQYSTLQAKLAGVGDDGSVAPATSPPSTPAPAPAASATTTPMAPATTPPSGDVPAPAPAAKPVPGIFKGKDGKLYVPDPATPGAFKPYVPPTTNQITQTDPTQTDTTPVPDASQGYPQFGQDSTQTG